MGNLLGITDLVRDVTFLVVRTGPMGKMALFILLVFSIMTWGIAAWKVAIYRLIKEKNRTFLAFFNQSKNLKEVAEGTESFSLSPLARLFREGYETAEHLEEKILREIKSSGPFPPDIIPRFGTLVSQNLDKMVAIEIEFLESYQTLMATVVSASPFVGLFGTVWGIMVAFRGVSISGAASIAVVASGLSEALITTVAGLGVAIPALFLYNILTRLNQKLVSDLEVFSAEMITMLEEGFLKKVLALSYKKGR